MYNYVLLKNCNIIVLLNNCKKPPTRPRNTNKCLKPIEIMLSKSVITLKLKEYS